MSLKAGTYTLKFDYAARIGSPLSSNTAIAKINNQVIKSVTPPNYNINTVNVQFTLNSDNSSSILQFCASGSSDTLGSLLDNVKLYYNDPCATIRINNY